MPDPARLLKKVANSRSISGESCPCLHNAVIEEINRDHVMLRYQGKIERLSLAEEGDCHRSRDQQKSRQ